MNHRILKVAESQKVFASAHIFKISCQILSTIHLKKKCSGYGTFFERNMSQIEKLSEIKPPLEGRKEGL